MIGLTQWGREISAEDIVLGPSTENRQRELQLDEQNETSFLRNHSHACSVATPGDRQPAEGLGSGEIRGTGECRN